MRGKEIPFIGNQLTVPDINSSPLIIVIHDGKAKQYMPPEHGETVIVTADKVVHRVQFKESEKF